jgi:hypothetical protein
MTNNTINTKNKQNKKQQMLGLIRLCVQSVHCNLVPSNLNINVKVTKKQNKKKKQNKTLKKKKKKGQTYPWVHLSVWNQEARVQKKKHKTDVCHLGCLSKC